MRRRHSLRNPPTVRWAVSRLDQGGMMRWTCHGCRAHEMWDAEEYLARVGPGYVIWNEIAPCLLCRGPRTLYSTTGAGTPYLPLKDEWLWLTRELGYGKDPDAWFEITWFSDPP